LLTPAGPILPSSLIYTDILKALHTKAGSTRKRILRLIKEPVTQKLNELTLVN
jgi:hypothetical protein